MTDLTKMEHLDQCPKCGGLWSETLDDGRKGYTWLDGNIVNDRVASWHCLHCGASWPRGDQSILQPIQHEGRYA